jgi:tetratricopeptide (TPR) repeat protein
MGNLNVPPPTSSSKNKRTRIEPSSRKRLIFLLITISLPAAFFVLLEIGLRIGGYGPDLSLFIKETARGKSYLTLNPAVKGRYFSRFQYVPSQPPDNFTVPKPAGTYRIFCLGASTTVGYPYWYNGAFSSFLRDRLRALFPDKRLEIINLGMTATNSFTVNDMARELVGYEPDLFIVYDGHNEFYGAMGIASHESLGGSRFLTGLSLRLVHYRTYLLLRSVVTSIAGIFHSAPAGAPSATLMETLARGQYIPYGSKVYREGLEIFKGNLNELRELVESHHIPVIISSQVSNLRGQSPFISDNREGLSSADAQLVENYLSQGRSLLSSGQFELAAAKFRQAIAIDSIRGDAHYLLAKSLDTLGSRPEARNEYIRARDFDQLRFRSSTEFNKAIHDISDDKFMYFNDVESFFAANSSDSIVGNELITEHLHPNSRGYFLIAKSYAGLMRRYGLMATTEEWQRADTLSDEILWESRPLTLLDERIAARRTEILTSGWPFQAQFPTVSAISEQDTIGQIVEKITRAQWNWIQAHDAAGVYYERRMELPDAAREYSVIINQVPDYDVQYYLRLGRIFLRQNNTAALQHILARSLDLEPTSLAYRALGDISLQSGHPLKALEYYTKLADFPQSTPEQIENGYLIATAYAKADSMDEARARILQVLKIRPDFLPGVKLLQEISTKTRH